MPAYPDPEFAQLRPGLWVWSAYAPSVKTDLFSAAVAASSGIYLIDPIPLADSDLLALTQAAPISGVIITNANHQRAALEYSERFRVPVLAHPETIAEVKPSRPGELSAIAGILESIEIESAVAGEIALYHPENGGTLVVGDALINLEPYGFAFLPRKYCLNEKAMRRSLRKLLPLAVERILFAHGTPIVCRAGERLRQLLEAGPLL